MKDKLLTTDTDTEKEDNIYFRKIKLCLKESLKWTNSPKENCINPTDLLSASKDFWTPISTPKELITMKEEFIMDSLILSLSGESREDNLATLKSNKSKELGKETPLLKPSIISTFKIKIPDTKENGKISTDMETDNSSITLETTMKDKLKII